MTPAQETDLVVLVFECIRHNPAGCLAALRTAVQSAPILVIGGEAELAALADPAMTTLPAAATREQIAEAVGRLLPSFDTRRSDAGTERHSATEAPIAVPIAALPTLDSFGLTVAEVDVLKLLSRGLSNPEIAVRRERAEGTVRAQVASILRKLKVRNRCEAMVIATRIVAVVNSQVGDSAKQALDIAGLLPHMRHRNFERGTVLFKKGDYSDCLYLIQKGVVRLPEFNATLCPHDTLGEIGIFAPDHRRTSTAVCETDVSAFVLDAEKVRQACFLNPNFAMHIVSTMAGRFSRNGPVAA